MPIPFNFARAKAPHIAITEILNEATSGAAKTTGTKLESTTYASNLKEVLPIPSSKPLGKQQIHDIIDDSTPIGPLNLSEFRDRSQFDLFGVTYDNGAPPRLMPGKSTIAPRENPFSETAERIAENYNRELPDAIMGDLRFAEEHSLYSMHQPMLRGGFGDIYQTHEARTRGVDVEPITSSEQAQNIAQLISSRIKNVSNAPMGELKKLSTAERLASEKGASAASFDDMIKARDLGNEAKLRREELLSGADVKNDNINSQAPRFSDPFDRYSTSLPTTSYGVGDLAGVDKVSRVSNLIGMEDVGRVTSEKRFGELTKGIDRIEGYDEVAHNATNANVVEEVAGVTNSNKADDLFGVYDPTRDPAKVGGIFGTMAGTSASGVLGSVGVGAGVGAIGSYMTGGDATEGMVAGGVAGLGLRGISGAINANAMGIQRGMYKSILGERAGNMTNAEMKQALRGVNKDDLNIGQKAAYSVLANPNKSSVGFNLRNQTLAGGFLAGAAFSSRRSDKRRGFNSHRGNRI